MLQYRNSKRDEMAKHSMTKQGVRNLDNIGSRKPKGKQLEEPPPEAFMTPGMGNGFGGRDQDDMLDEMYENRRESRR